MHCICLDTNSQSNALSSYLDDQLLVAPADIVSAQQPHHTRHTSIQELTQSRGRTPTAAAAAAAQIKAMLWSGCQPLIETHTLPFSTADDMATSQLPCAETTETSPSKAASSAAHEQVITWKPITSCFNCCSPGSRPCLSPATSDVHMAVHKPRRYQTAAAIQHR
jgi:hypothetical protein